MGKKKADPSLKGKKPINGANALTKHTVVKRNPSHVVNKIKRSELYGKYIQNKRLEKRHDRLKRMKEVEELGTENAGEAPVKKKNVPKTLDNTREIEPTMVKNNDEEILNDEADDEFASYFNIDSTIKPKVLITTRPHPSQQLFYFIADLQVLIPALHYYPRKEYSVKEIVKFATNRQFTHLMILSEKAKKCNGLMISHLQPHPTTGTYEGPTAFFKVSNVITSQNIPHHGASTSHIPELNLHGFNTRLGHRVERLLGSLFPHMDTQLQGRQIITFHNQRDYIFIRQHRYVFQEEKNQKVVENKIKKQPEENLTMMPHMKARLQELGPRFTLKLRWLQCGDRKSVV